MKNKITNIVLSLLVCAVAFCMFPIKTLAANVPNLEADASLELRYELDGLRIDGVTARIYRVADIDENFTTVLNDNFKNYHIELTGINTTEEWDALAQTLASYCEADNITSQAKGTCGEDGIVKFDKLSCGMYLVLSSQVQINDKIVNFSPALVSLPNRNQDGEWYNDVTVVPKGKQFIPSLDDVTYKVVKHWKNDNAVSRPKNIEIAIVKDGKVQSNQILSAANNWTYSWSAKDDGSVWSVVEINVPEKYTVTIEQNKTVFIVTNAGEKPQVPDTGEESSILPYILLMALSGMVLILFVMLKKKLSNKK